MWIVVALRQYPTEWPARQSTMDTETIVYITMILNSEQLHEPQLQELLWDYSFGWNGIVKHTDAATGE
eukprot:2863178-Amphidinium_carterae.1